MNGIPMTNADKLDPNATKVYEVFGRAEVSEILRGTIEVMKFYDVTTLRRVFVAGDIAVCVRIKFTSFAGGNIYANINIQDEIIVDFMNELNGQEIHVIKMLKLEDS